MQKSFYVTIAGASNVGKSTLLNSLVGSKVSIVTPKVQTTINLINGIAIYNDLQVVFTDTPGIFRPQNVREKKIVKNAWSGIKDSEYVFLLIDAKKAFCQYSKNIATNIKEKNIKSSLIINKIDLIAKEKLFALASEAMELHDFEQIFMISALKNDGTDNIMQYLEKIAPFSPWDFAEDQISDAPIRMLAEELTREQIFFALDQELPYSTTVKTEKWEELKDGSIKINQVIYAEKERYKKIIIGDNASMIKKIGEKSRKNISHLLNTKIHLFLYVRHD